MEYVERYIPHPPKPPYATWLIEEYHPAPANHCPEVPQALQRMIEAGKGEKRWALAGVRLVSLGHIRCGGNAKRFGRLEVAGGWGRSLFERSLPDTPPMSSEGSLYDID